MPPQIAPEPTVAPETKHRFLPPIGSPGYHILLGAVAIFILGPLGGISAAFMNFSIGFYISGQVLAGILGSTVTFPYGPEGKHGGNYMQTMAASVAGMGAMAVLIQAMIWLGLPEPSFVRLVLYMLCIGMFGVGVGMLYTPLLVDRMQLPYPSGFAVANILRALTDRDLLKRSITKLGGGMLCGFFTNFFALNLSWFSRFGLSEASIQKLDKLGISASTFGAGLIVGARIAIPAFVVGIAGWLLTPYLRSIQWLEPNQTYRKTGFIISLGAILGAAALDIVLILFQALRRYRDQAAEPAKPAEDWKRVNLIQLILWVVFWGAATVLVGHYLMGQPSYLLIAGVLLSFLFVLVNGISQGLSDWNPISSAFVATVFVLVLIGLHDAVAGLMSAAIVFIACSAGSDMQQDRSTGWRLGTNRVVQFRYQVIGITMGAVLAVVLAKLFMNAYPVLKIDQSSVSNIPGAEKWQSAMTLKLVGALKSITHPKPHLMTGLKLGIGIGLLIETARKFIKSRPGYKPFAGGSRVGKVTDFLLDAVLLPSPYASALGGFVELPSVLWYTAGGVAGSLSDVAQKRLAARRAKPAEGELPSDMSTNSLVGGGLIAGDSIAALSYGIYCLLKTVL
jgi:uncharacterized oligopeptide transporter (OPT) family protein